MMEEAVVWGVGHAMAGPTRSSVVSPASIEGMGALPGDLTDVVGPPDVTESSTKTGRAPGCVAQG